MRFGIIVVYQWTGPYGEAVGYSVTPTKTYMRTRPTAWELTIVTCKTIGRTFGGTAAEVPKVKLVLEAGMQSVATGIDVLRRKFGTADRLLWGCDLEVVVDQKTISEYRESEGL